YTWVWLPQGFHNSPILFHQCMANILQGVSIPSAIIQYVDGILIQTETEEEHYVLLEEVLGLLKNAGLKLNPSKAQLMRDSVTFLGVQINARGRIPDPANLPRPHKGTALRSFLRIVGFCHDFIEGYSEIVAPLYEHLKGNPGKEDELEWDPSSQEAFLQLKQALVATPALRSPDSTLPFIIEVVVSNTSIIAVLMQEGHGKPIPIGYFLCSFTPDEKTYIQCTKQILGIHWIVIHTKYICGFNNIIIRTPHTPVALLIKDGKPLAHYNDLMLVWDLVWEREPNTIAICKVKSYQKHGATTEGDHNNTIAQFAKQVAIEGEPWEEKVFLFPSVATTMKSRPSLVMDLVQFQLLDQELRNVHTAIIEGRPLPDPFHAHASEISLKGDVLYHTKPLTWITPQQLCRPLVLYFHQVSGHFSPAWVLEMLQGCYWWPSMKQETEHHLSYCLVCAQMNPLPKGPWDTLQIDYIGPLPTAKGGYKHILVIVHMFTRWVEAFPTRRNDASTTAKILWEQGFPHQIESDNGLHFIADVIRTMCSMLGIQQAFHIPYHPQLSGIVGRFNCTINSGLKKAILESTETMVKSSPNWVQALPGVLMAIRATTECITGHSPYELMTGRPMPIAHPSGVPLP
uniref:Gypsy retrotransposon integrase-like protein 1 n=1 Tax=Latimeria chalumnae TaxID=7897 RepID=H3AIL4_LATCH